MMKNKYLDGLEKIEFVLTELCTGNCRHCSQGGVSRGTERIDPLVAADAVRKIAGTYDIKTVMVFGGEPLLHPDAVREIMLCATELGIERRQVITNGFFSSDGERIRDMAKMLSLCGVNDLLLSVDAFHMEHIPIQPVRELAARLLEYGVAVRLNPAWLVGVDDENLYNGITRSLVSEFAEMGIPVGCGNVVFPEGNAIKYLAEYFTDSIPENPYTEDPCQIKCISFSANGDVLQGNVYKNDIMDIIEKYDPVMGNI